MHNDGYRKDSCYEMVRTPKGDYVIFHGDADYMANEMTVIDQEGNVVYRLDENEARNEFEIYFFHDVILMPDSTVAVLTENVSVDPISGWANGYMSILKFSNSWNPTQLFQIGAGCENEAKAEAFSDGTYITIEAGGASFISRIEAVGGWVWSDWLWDYSFTDVAITSSDTIIVATEQGVLIIDINGNVSDEKSNYIFDEIKISEYGEIIGVKNDSISVLSSDYMPISGFSFSGEYIDGFQSKGDTIVVLTQSDSIHVLINDDSLDLVGSFHILDDGSFDFIEINDEGVVISGTEWYGSQNDYESTQVPFVKEYSFEGDGYGLSNDVGIVNVGQAEETIVLYQGPSNYRVIFNDVKIVLRNYGENPIEEIYLWTKPNRRRRFDGFTVLPGEEMEVAWDEISKNFNEDPAGHTIGLCFWTSHPDNLMDLDASNDYMCADFLVNDEEIFSENKISVHPNPAINYLNINSTTPIFKNNSSSISIFNSTGNKIMKIPYSEKIDISHFNSGLYFLKIKNGEGQIWSEKIIVQK